MAAEDVGPKKKKEQEDEKRRKKVTPGSLMKAILRSGGGTAKPAEGDQVMFHCTTRTMEGVVVHSTRSEHGGNGYPIRQVIGKSKMILGLSEGIPTMLKGEVAMFKMKPDVHYAEVDCPVAAPKDFPINEELQFTIEMLDFFKVKVVSEDLGVVKKVIGEGQGWECPREPYEVAARPRLTQFLKGGPCTRRVCGNVSKMVLKVLATAVVSTCRNHVALCLLDNLCRYHVCRNAFCFWNCRNAVAACGEEWLDFEQKMV